jgi:hypothetical protein
MRVLPLILSSDSHVFEPPDLWQTRIGAAFRDRAPRIQRIDDADQIVVEADQILSGIGLISNAGARFEAPETISGQGRLEDVQRGGYDPEQHLKDMAPWPWRRENRAWISSSARANQACQVVALLTRSLGQREDRQGFDTFTVPARDATGRSYQPARYLAQGRFAIN